MATILVDDFTQTKYESTEEELQAMALNPLQQSYIRNLLAKYANDRITLEVDHTVPDAVQAYMLAQQKVLGSIEALQYLLAISIDAYNALVNTQVRS